MGKHERHVYLEAIRNRYHKAKRADKGKILDEFCSVCGYQRKYAIRLLSGRPTKMTRRAGRPSQYDEPALTMVLRKLWLATDQMCSKRLVVAIPLWLPHYEASFGALGEPVRAKLMRFRQPALTACSSRCEHNIPRDWVAPSQGRS